MISKMVLVVVLIAIVIGSAEALKVGPGQPRGDEIHRAEMIFQNANSLYKSGKLQEAVSKYRESLNLHPNNADTYTNLGSALLDLEKTEDAIEAYEQALGFGPVKCRCSIQPRACLS
jgi:tetratricopeptide (TPR) repeat protein